MSEKEKLIQYIENLSEKQVEYLYHLVVNLFSDSPN